MGPLILRLDDYFPPENDKFFFHQDFFFEFFFSPSFTRRIPCASVVEMILDLSGRFEILENLNNCDRNHISNSLPFRDEPPSSSSSSSSSTFSFFSFSNWRHLWVGVPLSLKDICELPDSPSSLPTFLLTRMVVDLFRLVSVFIIFAMKSLIFFFRGDFSSAIENGRSWLCSVNSSLVPPPSPLPPSPRPKKGEGGEGKWGSGSWDGVSGGGGFSFEEAMGHYYFILSNLFAVEVFFIYFISSHSYVI